MAVLLSIMVVATALWSFGVELAEGAGMSGRGTGARIAAAAPSTTLSLPAISGSSDKTRPLIVIDPGHGGQDPGAISGSGLKEADATLALARTLQSELAASPRLRVAITRSDNTYLPLAQRYEIARRLGADLFISVHADAAPLNQAARGATIYTLSEVASDREAALLAARENEAGGMGGVDASGDAGVNRILIDLAQRETMIASADFARLLHREAAPLIPFQSNFHRFASFVVLKAPDMPSVLLEAGYLTNAEDEAFIVSEEGRRRIAQGLRKAAETYFARRAIRPTA